MALVIQQKFLKIPPYVILVVRLVVQFIRSLEFLPDRGAPALEKSVDRILTLAIHIGFGEHLKIWNEPVTGSNMFYDSVDLTGICTGFLSEELVAGEAQDLEGLVRVLLCECIERVVLRGVASEGGEVHHQEDLSCVLWLREGDVSQFLNVFCCKVMEACGIFWLLTFFELVFRYIIAKTSG